MSFTIVNLQAAKFIIITSTGKLSNVFKELGFRNIFCRGCLETEKGMDLFILLEEDQVNLCCFRTLDGRNDPEVSSAQFCAAKFWIPERVIGKIYYFSNRTLT